MATTASRLNDALAACRGGFAAVVLFSLCINVLMLTAPLYMLQMFDRVLSSRSTDTLIALTAIAVIAILTMAALELVRTSAMVRMSLWLERKLGGEVLASSISATLRRVRVSLVIARGKRPEIGRRGLHGQGQQVERKQVGRCLYWRPRQ